MPNKTEDRQLHDTSKLIIETFLYQILTEETFDFHSTLHINLRFKKWALGLAQPCSDVIQSTQRIIHKEKILTANRSSIHLYKMHHLFYLTLKTKSLIDN